MGCSSSKRSADDDFSNLGSIPTASAAAAAGAAPTLSKEARNSKALSPLNASGPAETERVSSPQTARDSPAYKLYFAAQAGDVKTVNSLLPLVQDIDDGRLTGRSALHAAAAGGKGLVIGILLRANASVLSPSQDGSLPLATAASAGHVECVRFLLDAGAPVNAVAVRIVSMTVWSFHAISSQKDGSSALHRAAANGHHSVVQVLLEANADPTLKTKAGKSALDEATLANHAKVISLLAPPAAVAATPMAAVPPLPPPGVSVPAPALASPPPARVTPAPPALPSPAHDAEVVLQVQDVAPQQAVPPPKLPTTGSGNSYLQGKYLVNMEPIHRSDASTVWKALESVVGGRAVVIKVLQRKDAWEREQLVRTRVSAEYVIPILEAFEGPGPDGASGFVMIMPQAEETLAQVIDARGGKLPVIECRSILRSVAVCLSQLHEHGMLHADLTASNVLAKGRSWVLCDFESSVSLRSAAADMPRVSVSQCPPEMAKYLVMKQDFVPTESYDVWQFGLLAYQVVTGSKLFDDGAATLGRLCSDQPVTEQDLAGVQYRDPAAAGLLQQMLVANPAARRPFVGRDGLLMSSYFGDGATSDVSRVKAMAATILQTMESQHSEQMAVLAAVQTDVHALKSQLQALFNLVSQLPESAVPRVFQMLPDEDSSWFSKLDIFQNKFRLHLLCECNEQGTWHFTSHPGLVIKQPKPFLVKALPYLDVLLRVLAIASRVGVCFGIPIPMIPADLAAQLGMEAKALNSIGSALHQAVRTSEVQVQHMSQSAVQTMDTYRVQRDIDIATEDSARIEAFRSAASQIELEAASGPAFRALQVVLEAHDRMGDYGGLFRVVHTTTGEIKWVCAEHSKLPQFAMQPVDVAPADDTKADESFELVVDDKPAAGAVPAGAATVATAGGAEIQSGIVPVALKAAGDATS